MSSLLLKTENILGDAGMTVLIGLVVVFAALLVLTFVFWLFGKVAGMGGQTDVTAAPTPKKSHKKENAPDAALVAAIAGAIAMEEDEVSDEVAAVIAAAVAAMSTGSTRYAVRRIRPVSRPAWGAAGLADNTQPF